MLCIPMIWKKDRHQIPVTLLCVTLSTLSLVMPAALAFAKAAPKSTMAKSVALPRKAAPQGVLEVPSGGLGRILTSRMSGTRSARKMLVALRLGIAGYFDASPKLTAVFADRADQNVQAAFTAKLKSVPVRGVMAIQMQGKAGQATLIFDRAAAFRQTFARLTQRVNGSAARRGPRQVIAPVRLNMTPLLDGSGQIGLPPGWRFTGLLFA